MGINNRLASPSVSEDYIWMCIKLLTHGFVCGKHSIDATIFGFLPWILLGDIARSVEVRHIIKGF